MNLVSLLFGFKGRINRAQFWVGTIAAFTGCFLLAVVMVLAFLPSFIFPKTPEEAVRLVVSLIKALCIPLFLAGWIGSALQTKRFHDRGRSGLWTLLPYLPMTMLVIGAFQASTNPGSAHETASSFVIWWIVMQAVNVFMLVDLGCLKGTPGPNKYGAPPSGGLSGGGGGAPIGTTPVPGSKTATPAPTMAAGMMSAESAIERAIAERARQAQAPQQTHPAPRAPASSPAGGMRPATAGSFGRKATP